MLDWHAAFGIIAGIIQVSAVVPYVRDMLHGTTRPNIVSWALWTLVQLIVIAAVLSVGTSWSVIILFAMTFNTGLITILGLLGYGYKQYSWVDWSCLALAILAIVLWQITNQPLFALVLLIFADIVIAIPTVAKTYRDPFSETSSSWLLIAIAAALSVISAKEFIASNIIFQAYLVVINLFICLLAFFGQRLKRA